MQSNLMPILAHRDDMRIVEVDGQPVVTARDLARALGYLKDNAVAKIYDRNRDSFSERDSFIVDTRMFVPNMGMNHYNQFTPILGANPQGGDPHIRVFTKRGALKVIMKSNQPRAVAVQEALIDLYEQVERGDLVSVGYLRDTVRDLRLEINRLSEIVSAAGLPASPQVVYLPRPWKKHSFDDAALAFLQELFNRKPYARIAELERNLRREATKQGWKVGSRSSVYRVVEGFKH